MRLPFILVMTFLAALTACSKHEQPSPATEVETEKELAPPAPVIVDSFLPLSAEPVTMLKYATKCKKGQCAEVRIDSLRFPANSALTALIEQSLVGQTGDLINEGGSSYESYIKSYLADAVKNGEASLTAKLIRQTGPLVLLRLDTYVYSGGAHGMPGSAFLNFDRRRNKRLSLDDVVRDGKRAALMDKLREVHGAWRQQEGYTDADFLKTWPFVETDNFALMEDGIVFGYAAYEIAPYAAGLPELKIPYVELQDILKPEWLMAKP